VSSIARKSPLISPFKKLAVSNLAAHMSDQIALIAIPLVAVTALDAGGGATSIIQMLNTLPYLLLAVPFGLLVDRGRRRGIMTAGELVRTLAILVLIEGARFVSGHEVLRPIVITAILFNTGWFCLQGVYVAYAMTRLDMTSGQTGLTLTLYGVGMVVGSRLAGVLAGRVWFGRLVVIGPICGALASTLMIASLVWPTWLLPSLAWLLLGSGPMIWTISTTTLRQMITPPDMLGRVSALLVTSTAGFRPVGAGLGAVSYLLGGYEAVLTVSWVAFLAQAAVIIRSRAARVTDIPALETPQVAVN